MGILLIAAVLGLIPAFIAKNKGRSFPLWWLYGYSVESNSALNNVSTSSGIDINVQAYAFSLAAGKSCVIKYNYYQSSGNMVKLADYLLVIASKS